MVQNLNVLTQAVKINSQLDRINDAVITPQSLSNFGEVTFNSTGGTISYYCVFLETIDYLSSWANILLTINNDPTMNTYISGDNVDINSWNNYYYGLNSTDQTNSYITSTLINQNYSLLKNLKVNYLYNLTILNNISETEMDNIYVLATTGTGFNSFQTMLIMFETFYNSIILQIYFFNSISLLAQVTILNKHNNLIPLINVTT